MPVATNSDRARKRSEQILERFSPEWESVEFFLPTRFRRAAEDYRTTGALKQ
jgi:hypothetical protein